MKGKGAKIFLIFFFVIVGVGVGGVGGYMVWNSRTEDESEPDTQEEKKEETSGDIVYPTINNRFANYPEIKVDFTPSLEEYEVEAGLSNVYIVDNLDLSQDVLSALEEDYFIVEPSDTREYFDVYEKNYYNQIPSFVTTDSVLHTYHLIFDSTLKRLEEDKFIPIIDQLSKDMVDKSQEQMDGLEDEDFQEAALRNIAFFSVGAKLIDPSFSVPSEVENEVTQELDLIEAASGIEYSVVMAMGFDEPRMKEDYSQYKPRGHYTKSEALKRYFKTMMWYGRLTFLADEESSTRSALLITNALRDEDIFTQWDSVFEPINFFVGKADDLVFYDYDEVVTTDYGTENELTYELIEDEEKFAKFHADVKELRPPEINSIPIGAPAIDEDKEKEIKGFRFMGQRFTFDASVFQNLIYREVGNKNGEIPDLPDDTTRMLPKALDIPAAMGSDTALEILEEQGEFEYFKYEENMKKIRTETAKYDTDKWGQNLYWAWLYSLKPLTDVYAEGSGYPSFMTNEKWAKKDLNTFLGSWTELKHDTILYAKQAMAELGAAMPDEDFRGYVEPNVYVWNRMLSLVKMTEEGLSSRDLLTSTTQGDLDTLEETLEMLRDISIKELQDEKLTEEDYNFIEGFGGTLETIFLNSLDSDYPDKFAALQDNPAPIVADVASDPNGAVLEEGTGYVFNIYVLVPVEGELRVAKGGVYSHYEFTVGLSERMTDEEWREQLDAGDAPEMEDWKKEFIVE